jgi:two-component system chemotaxis response regulator CheB
VVDDSALMRKLLADLLRSAPEVDVVGTARDGEEAVTMAADLKPDVITLDIEMPGRTGLEVLPDLLALHNPSVIMVSAHTKQGAEVTLAALELGACDFFPKPDRNQLGQMREARDQLVDKVLSAAQARPRRRRKSVSSPGTSRTSAGEATAEPRVSVPAVSARCLAIGISTGGPQALGAILPLVKPPIPPILVVQHMPAQFTAVFAERLNRACSFEVKEAEEGDRVMSGRVLVAPGGQHMSLSGPSANARVTLSDPEAESVSGHKPSVDVLFESVARTFQTGAVAIIMTGMGRDGVEGCRKVLASGGVTLGQDEATSAVYGMNKVAQKEGVLCAQFALNQLPNLIRKFCPKSDS